MEIIKKLNELSLYILPFCSKRRAFVKNIFCLHVLFIDFLKIKRITNDFNGNKKTMLFIDETVPKFDKDAGSRSVFQYLKYFCEAGFSVKFIYDDFIENKYYNDILRNIGIEVLDNTYYKFFWKKWTKKNKEKFDYIFLSRPLTANKYIDYFKKHTSAKIYYLGHDLYFLREFREFQLTKKKHLLLSFKIKRKIELSVLRKADVSYYVSQYEIKYLKELDSNYDCKIIPINIFRQKAIEKFDNSRKDLLFIGSFRHNPNLDAVLWFINNIFNTVKQEIPDIILYVIGSNAPKEILELNSSSVKVLGYIDDSSLDSYYSKCRVSIAPLRYGAGVKGKITEALYKQIPVITTSIGAEGLPEIEDCLVIKDEEEEFAKELVNMYNDAELLSKLSINGFNYILKHFTKNKMDEILKEDF